MKNFKRVIVLIIFVVSLVTITSCEQVALKILTNDYNQPDPITWFTYTTVDGLASNDVNNILEDSDGNMWFGTYRGVSKYTGRNWYSYDLTDSGYRDEIYSMYEDRNRDIWFGLYGKISKYDGDTFTSYLNEQGYMYGRAESIIEDVNGIMWFGLNSYSEGALLKYNRIDFITVSDSLLGSNINSLSKDSHTTMWIANSDGLTLFSGKEWSSFTNEIDSIGTNISEVFVDSDNIVWFYSSNGLGKYENGNFEFIADYHVNQYANVTSIFEDSDGNLWFSTSNRGVYFYDGYIWTRYSSYSGLPSNNINSVYEDSVGNMWFATDAGACRHNFIEDE